MPSTLLKLTDRISLLELCNSEFQFGTCVEIGVASGCFTKQILASWPSVGTLFAIDAWKHFESGYMDACNLSQEEQDGRFEQVLKDFGDNGTVQIMRELSTDAAKLFLSNSVHFIYLDANHSKKAVREDLEAWWPKLRSGGIFAGHDYLPGNGAGYGVKSAVDEFAAEWRIPVFKTTEEHCRESGVYGRAWEGCSFALRKE